MRGISEDDLWKIVNSPYATDGFIPVSLLINRIKELNDWKPIDENTPKDKPILLFFPADYAPFYDVGELRFTLDGDYRPTHYKELTPPKEQP